MSEGAREKESCGGKESCDGIKNAKYGRKKVMER